MESKVTFESDGLRLAGVLHQPKGMTRGERRPAMLALHGFGTGKDSGTTRDAAKLFAQMGYVVLRFDFRGCGESEGEYGRLLCLEQVSDTRNALSYMASREDVDPKRIGVMGHSFGAAVAIYTAGTDPRVAATISSCGWGNGEIKFRGQHSGPDEWDRFTKMLDDGKRVKAETGKSPMVSRWDIVPIPVHLRGNLPADSVMEFPADTAQSMFDFRPNDVVGKIAPRPLMLFHAANDSVTPTDQSLELFRHAGQPTDLILLADIDHFPFSEKNPRAREILRIWLELYFPLR